MKNLDIDSKSFTIKISITIKFFIFGTILEAEFVSCLNIGKALNLETNLKPFMETQPQQVGENSKIRVLIEGLHISVPVLCSGTAAPVSAGSFRCSVSFLQRCVSRHSFPFFMLSSASFM